MGEINKIKGNKPKRGQNRLFMVSIHFDIYAGDHKEAVYMLEDYLEWCLTCGLPTGKEKSFKKPVPRLKFEASELDKKNTTNVLDNGVTVTD